MKARATNLLLYQNFDTLVTLACVSDITNETLVSGNKFPKYINKETKKQSGHGQAASAAHCSPVVGATRGGTKEEYPPLGMSEAEEEPL